METINHLITLINDRFLGYILMTGLIGVGLYFTIATRFVQFLSPRRMWQVLTIPSSETKDSAKHISSFQAFAISTASRVGTGNIAGVAIAITTGGPGAVFWMWLIAIISSASAFAESTLAQLYKVKDGAFFRGGPAYYMQKALHSPWLGASFSVIITLTFAFVFNSVQSNTIALSLEKTFGILPVISGLGLCCLTALIIFGGLKRIADFSAVIVPFFAICYIGVTLAVLALNWEKIPSLFQLIFTDAFSLRNAAGGALGATIMIGARRGLFSNEAGMGSAPNAAATAQVLHPVSQGYAQAVGVFVDTLLICSCTAFIILTSSYSSLGGEGIALTQNALSQTLGRFGNYFISFSVLLFAFTSIIGNYYYGQANVQFLTSKKSVLFIFRFLVCIMVLWGSVSQLSLVWNLADLFMSIMALMNISVIWLLRKQVLSVLKDYRRQKKNGQEIPVYQAQNTPEIKNISSW